MYNTYLRYRVRKLPQQKEQSLEKAIEFLQKTGNVGVVVDVESGKEYTTVEELKDVK